MTLLPATAFIGPALRGPLRGPPPLLRSWAEYEALHGGEHDLPGNTRRPPLPNLLAGAVRLFFANGGGALYVVRVSAVPGRWPVLSSYQAGLRRLGKLAAVNVFAAPALGGQWTVEPQAAQAVQQALLATADGMPGARRFLVLDGPPGIGPADLLAWRQGLDSTRTALYHPWLVVQQAGPVEHRLPPSGAVCGVVARVDAQHGLWKAPANEPLQGVSRLDRDIANAEQDLLTQQGVNPLRGFAGRGLLVWGARTLAGDSAWRYVPVRRFADAVEAEMVALLAATTPRQRNEEALWAQVRQQAQALLMGHWRRGALQGDKPEQAFYVACGLGSTMTAADVQARRLVCELGLAPLRPAEFIPLRVSRTLGARR